LVISKITTNTILTTTPTTPPYITQPTQTSSNKKLSIFFIWKKFMKPPDGWVFLLLRPVLSFFGFFDKMAL